MTTHKTVDELYRNQTQQGYLQGILVPFVKPSNVVQRVANGMALLRQHYSVDDIRRINVDTLLIEKPCACVFGQLEGNYITVCERLGFVAKDMQDFGVYLSEHEVEYDSAKDQLNQQWKRALVDF